MINIGNGQVMLSMLLIKITSDLLFETNRSTCSSNKEFNYSLLFRIITSKTCDID